MSAPNFYSLAGTVYAIEIQGDDDLILDDTQENIFYELAANKKIEIEHLDEYSDDARSYGGRVFASIKLKNSDDAIQAEIKLLSRGGYYAHANIDFDGRIYSGYDGEYYEPSELDADTIREHVEGYDGRKLYGKRAAAKLDRLERDLEQLRTIADQVTSQFTTPLITRGTFSNGERVYAERSK